MEKHHRVQVLDVALEAAVKLSSPLYRRPATARQVGEPARHRVRPLSCSHHATPAEVEDCQRRIEALTTENEIIERERAIGVEIGERADKVSQALSAEGKATRRAARSLGA